MKNLMLIIAAIIMIAGCGAQSPAQPQSQQNNNNLIGGPTDKGLGGPFNTASGARGIF